MIDHYGKLDNCAQEFIWQSVACPQSTNRSMIHFWMHDILRMSAVGMLCVYLERQVEVAWLPLN